MLFTVSLPLAGAFLLWFVPRRAKGFFSSLILAGVFLSALLTLRAVLGDKQLLSVRYLLPWFSISFIADGLSVFMAAVSSLVAFLISLYSWEYMEHYADSGGFYFWMVLFVGSMMGLIFSANLILLFCFWEITSVCSWRLIAFYRREEDLKAADKAFLITFLGASLMLAGIILIYLAYGTLEIGALKGIALTNLVAFLLLAGIVSKSAQLPLQSWLPDAGVAPTPVTALLHAAVLVKIGVYVFARLFNLTFVSGVIFTHTAIFLSVVTILVAAGSALVEQDIKRILAYSTISQLGYILLALALNSAVTLKIALLYILAHSLAKAGLFLCAGIIEQKTGTKNINELGGLARTMPYTAAAYLLCAFSVIGIPPFLGFWPKFMLVLVAMQSGYILVGSLCILGAILTLFYLMRLFNKVFWQEAKVNAGKAREKQSIMVWVVLTLGILSLLLGVMFGLPFNLVGNLIR